MSNTIDKNPYKPGSWDWIQYQNKKAQQAKLERDKNSLSKNSYTPESLDIMHKQKKLPSPSRMEKQYKTANLSPQGKSTIELNPVPQGPTRSDSSILPRPTGHLEPKIPLPSGDTATRNPAIDQSQIISQAQSIASQADAIAQAGEPNRKLRTKLIQELNHWRKLGGDYTDHIKVGGYDVLLMDGKYHAVKDGEEQVFNTPSGLLNYIYENPGATPASTPASATTDATALTRTPEPMPAPAPSPTPIPSEQIERTDNVGYNFEYNWSGKHITPEFKEKVLDICEKLKMNPDDLMAIMAFESAGINPSAVNKASGATGLIQFMPSTAESLGTTTEALADMTALEQLDYVYKYLKPYAGKMNTIQDAYMAVFMPIAVGKSNDFVLGIKDSKEKIAGDLSYGKVYEQNAGLDINGDGIITKEEAAQKVVNKRDTYHKINPGNNTVTGERDLVSAGTNTTNFFLDGSNKRESGTRNTVDPSKELVEQVKQSIKDGDKKAIESNLTAFINLGPNYAAYIPYNDQYQIYIRDCQIHVAGNGEDKTFHHAKDALRYIEEHTTSSATENATTSTANTSDMPTEIIAQPPSNYNNNEQAQYYINKMGFDIGEIDGIIGPKTQSALIIFQYSQGLPITGNIDAATLEALQKCSEEGKSINDGSVFTTFTPKPTDIGDPGGGRIDVKNRGKEPDDSELVNIGGYQLHRDAAIAWAYLYTAARAAGINGSLLKITSGYRSVKRQEELWEAALEKYVDPEVADNYVARPGASEHHTGFAIDLRMSYPNNSDNIEKLKNTKEYKWMVENAAKFGFYNYEGEPWHWVYNPPR